MGFVSRDAGVSASESELSGAAALDGPLPCEDVRLRIVSEAATIASFATALGAALGVDVVVEQSVLDRQVTLVASDITVERLRRVLRGNDLALAYDPTQRVLVVFSETFALQVRERAGHHCLVGEEPDTRLFPPFERVPAEYLARYFCEHLASADGWADVIGDVLVVHDNAWRVTRFEGEAMTLARAIDSMHRASRDGGVPR